MREPTLRLKTVWKKFKETMKNAKESAAPAQPVPHCHDCRCEKCWPPSPVLTPDDTEFLNWLIFYSARIVIHESAERVTIKWYSATDESTEGDTGPLDCSPREAICKAMEMEKSGNVTAKRKRS